MTYHFNTTHSHDYRWPHSSCLTPKAEAPNSHCEKRDEGINKPWCGRDAPAPPPRSELEPPRTCPDTAPTADRPWCQRGPLVPRISPHLAAPPPPRLRPDNCPAEYLAQHKQSSYSFCNQNQTLNGIMFDPNGFNVDYQTSTQPNWRYNDCCSNQHEIIQKPQTRLEGCFQVPRASINKSMPKMGPEGCFEEPLTVDRHFKQVAWPEIASARVGASSQQDTSQYNQPDQYLKQLCDKYSKPTAVVTATPRDELMRRVYADRYRTTYQADFCKNGDDAARLLASCDNHEPNQRFEGQETRPLLDCPVRSCQCGCGCQVAGRAQSTIFSPQPPLCQVAGRAQSAGDSLFNPPQPPLCRPAPISHNVHFSCCYTTKQKQTMAGKALNGESVGPPEKLPPWISEYSDVIGRTGQVIIDQKLLHPKKKQRKF